MTGLAWWLLVVGAVDLLRARRDASTPTRRAVLAAIAAALVLGGAVTAHPADGTGWLASVVAAALAAAWVVGSGVALGGASHTRAAALGYAAFALGLLVLALAGSRTGHMAWLDETLRRSIVSAVGSDRLLVCAAVVVVQLSTADIAIRLLLDLVGVPAQDNEKTLRGGHLLGPMERLVIVGLGTRRLAGGRHRGRRSQSTAALSRAACVERGGFVRSQ